MILASKGIIPPKEWYHDPKLKNNDNKTVALLLIFKCETLPNEWLYDINIEDLYGDKGISYF